MQQRSVDLQCIADPKGATYGCASDAKAPTTALQGFEVTSKDTKVCIYAGSDQLQCFESQSAADAAQKGITPAPKTSTSASALGPRVDLRDPVPESHDVPGSGLEARRVLPDRHLQHRAQVLHRLRGRAGGVQVDDHEGRPDVVVHQRARHDPEHVARARRRPRRPPGNRSRRRRRAPPGGTGRARPRAPRRPARRRHPPRRPTRRSTPRAPPRFRATTPPSRRRRPGSTR